MDNTVLSNINNILSIIYSVIVKWVLMGFRNRSGRGSGGRGSNRSGRSGGCGNKSNSKKTTRTTGSSTKNNKMEFTAYQEGKTSRLTFDSVKK